MLFRATVLLILFAAGFFVSAAPTTNFTSFNATTDTFNLSLITSGFCGTSNACNMFVPPMPVITDCNMTSCQCNTDFANGLKTCLQCGYDNIAGVPFTTVQQYMSNYTSACTTNGTPVPGETLVVNNGASIDIGFRGTAALWMTASAVLISFA